MDLSRGDRIMTNARKARRAREARKALIERVAETVVILLAFPAVGIVFAAIGMVLSVN